MLEYRLLGSSLGINLVSSVGFYKEIFILVFIGSRVYYRIAAVKISSGYFKNHNNKSKKNFIRINLINFFILIIISGVESNLFFILFVIAFLENIQHL